MFLAKETEQALLYSTSGALPKPHLVRPMMLTRRAEAWDHGSTRKTANQ